MSRYIALRPLAPDKAIEVLERDDKGVLVGAWFGYWNFKKGTVALYPNVTNHAVNWPGGVIPSGRQVISDRMVERKENAESKVQKAELTFSTASGPPLSRGRPNTEGEAGGGVQQKIKFY